MDGFALLICNVDRSRVPAGVIHPDLFPGQRMLSIVTWTAQESVLRVGLPRGSICGVLRDDTKPIEPENFIENRDFINILHYICCNHPDPDLETYAARTAETRIAIIDQRSPDVNAEIPPEDILGVYEVENRKVVNYQANPNYRIVTKRGPCQLTPWLRNCLHSAVLSKQQ